jgi:hypothetical protein
LGKSPLVMVRIGTFVDIRSLSRPSRLRKDDR